MDLVRLFAAAETALVARQAELNAADPANRNHGDHMVEIFQLAAQAAGGQGRSLAWQPSGEPDGANLLADAMDSAAELLRGRPQNGSAQVYARGLAALAAQFRQRGLGLADLVPYVRRTLQKEESGVSTPEPAPARSADVLKALLNGLAAWEKGEGPAGLEAGAPGVGAPAGISTVEPDPKSALDMGYLFGVGMSYLQAKQKGGDPLDILVDTVVSASPLAGVPHRANSGKIALRALLEAMGAADGAEP